MKVLKELLREKIKKELEELGEFTINRKRKYKLYRTMKTREISLYELIREIGKVKTNLISYTFCILPYQKISTQKLFEIFQKYENEFFIEKKIYITPSLYSEHIYIDLFKPYDLNLLLEIIKELKN